MSFISSISVTKNTNKFHKGAQPQYNVDILRLTHNDKFPTLLLIRKELLLLKEDS